MDRINKLSLPRLGLALLSLRLAQTLGILQGQRIGSRRR